MLSQPLNNFTHPLGSPFFSLFLFFFFVATTSRSRVNCIPIDPVFISICREFMCKLSGWRGENGGYRGRERKKLVVRGGRGDLLSLTTIQFAFHPINPSSHTRRPVLASNSSSFCSRISDNLRTYLVVSLNRVIL